MDYLLHEGVKSKQRCTERLNERIKASERARRELTAWHNAQMGFLEINKSDWTKRIRNTWRRLAQGDHFTLKPEIVAMIQNQTSDLSMPQAYRNDWTRPMQNVRLLAQPGSVYYLPPV